MKSCFLTLAALMLLASSGCRNNEGCREILSSIKADIIAGNLNKAVITADSVINLAACDSSTKMAADSLRQIAERIKIDFSLDENTFLGRAEQRIGSLTEERKTALEKSGFIEYRIIDGRKMYFNRAASNLALLLEFYENKNRKTVPEVTDPEMLFRRDHTYRIIRETGSATAPVIPVSMEITYTLTVNHDAVPDGETVRCWLPYPSGAFPRQSGIELLETSEPSYLIAPDTAIHKTIYMEARAVSGKPLVFRTKFRYTSSAAYFDPAATKSSAYDKSSALYIKYTSEQAPHICFTESVKKLADSIAGTETDPRLLVRKIYMWFKENIPWAGALEYSIMPNIPEYVISNRRGDCGMQTFLFMSMLRYKGIPVRWQSGWMVPPGAENLHDWCEVWYEGSGWAPADVSYDLIPATDDGHREFYLSGIDSYRLIVNNGIAGPLYPPKHFLRSEPYDFQRGEVEWKGGNLYFDKWDYEMEIKYLVEEGI